MLWLIQSISDSDLSIILSFNGLLSVSLVNNVPSGPDNEKIPKIMYGFIPITLPKFNTYGAENDPNIPTENKNPVPKDLIGVG